MNDTGADSPFSYADASDPLWKRLAIGAVERATGARHIEALYRARQAQGWREGDVQSFFANRDFRASLSPRIR